MPSAPRIPGLTTIVVPSYNHAAYLADALESALAQTRPVQVVVVDDASTDTTAQVLERYAGRVEVIRHETQLGPSAARNHGIDQALGEFLMFLDADDVVAPDKVARQVAELEASPAAGFCLCDVRIEDEAKGRTVNASIQYSYGTAVPVTGWIDKALAAANYIPIMSPLIRTEALGQLRFSDLTVPEDWYFWLGLAAWQRACYVGKVLATYRHRKTGRSRLPKASRTVVPNIVAPLRLNLGCGTPGTRSWHPIDGLVNLDKSMGWTYESGLGDFADGSVSGITISHSLMYLAEAGWPAFCRELARVLADGGVVRITEDETSNPASKRHGGWQGSQPAVTLTSPAFVRKQLERAGLEVVDLDAETTTYRDRSLIQAQHGSAPDVFFLEGVKPSRVLFAPHNDDEALFAAFTILRYRPRVVVCFPSSGDYGDPAARERESRAACEVLGASGVTQWDGRQLELRMRAYDGEYRPTVVWAPHWKTSHRDHLAVSNAAAAVFGDRVRWYHTYTEAGKVREGRLVEYETEWVEQKLRALLRYETQIRHPRASKFFADDLAEYAFDPSTAPRG